MLRPEGRCCILAFLDLARRARQSTNRIFFGDYWDRRGFPVTNDAVALLALGFLPSFSVILVCPWKSSRRFSCSALLFLRMT